MAAAAKGDCLRRPVILSSALSHIEGCQIHAVCKYGIYTHIEIVFVTLFRIREKYIAEQVCFVTAADQINIKQSVPELNARAVVFFSHFQDADSIFRKLNRNAGEVFSFRSGSSYVPAKNT